MAVTDQIPGYGGQGRKMSEPSGEEWDPDDVGIWGFSKKHPSRNVILLRNPADMWTYSQLYDRSAPDGAKFRPVPEDFPRPDRDDANRSVSERALCAAVDIRKGDDGAETRRLIVLEMPKTVYQTLCSQHEMSGADLTKRRYAIYRVTASDGRVGYESDHMPLEPEFEVEVKAEFADRLIVPLEDGSEIPIEGFELQRYIDRTEAIIAEDAGMHFTGSGMKRREGTGSSAESGPQKPPPPMPTEPKAAPADEPVTPGGQATIWSKDDLLALKATALKEVAEALWIDVPEDLPTFKAERGNIIDAILGAQIDGEPF